MNDYTEKVGNKLNDLLKKNYDAAQGYAKAAENVKDENLRKYFKRKSEERERFQNELKSEINTRFDQETVESGSITGAAHRAWMDVKSFFSLDNDESMLEAAISGEKAALSDYEDVLCENELCIPQETAELLMNQKVKISSDLETIKSLEDLK